MAVADAWCGSTACKRCWPQTLRAVPSGTGSTLPKALPAHTCGMWYCVPSAPTSVAPPGAVHSRLVMWAGGYRRRASCITASTYGKHGASSSVGSCWRIDGDCSPFWGCSGGGGAKGPSGQAHVQMDRGWYEVLHQTARPLR